MDAVRVAQGCGHCVGTGSVGPAPPRSWSRLRGNHQVRDVVENWKARIRRRCQTLSIGVSQGQARPGLRGSRSSRYFVSDRLKYGPSKRHPSKLEARRYGLEVSKESPLGLRMVESTNAASTGPRRGVSYFNFGVSKTCGPKASRTWSDDASRLMFRVLAAMRTTLLECAQHPAGPPASRSPMAGTDRGLADWIPMRRLKPIVPLLILASRVSRSIGQSHREERSKDMFGRRHVWVLGSRGDARTWTRVPEPRRLIIYRT